MKRDEERSGIVAQRIADVRADLAALESAYASLRTR